MLASPQTSAPDAMRQAAAAADAALKAHMAHDQRLAGMGSTFVAILFRQSSAVIAHAGDSRCYRLHRGRMVFRTQDHSLVGELVRKRALTEEQARTSPQSNLITRGLGSVSNAQPDVDIVPYCRADRFVLCTDGVWGIMEHRLLLSQLRRLKDLATDVPRMADEIDRIGFGQGGHHDNHTFVVIDVETNSTLKDRLAVRLMEPRVLMAAAAMAGVLTIGGGGIAWQCRSSQPSALGGAGGGQPSASSALPRPSQLFTPQDSGVWADSGRIAPPIDTTRSASKPDSVTRQSAKPLSGVHQHETQLLDKIKRNVKQLQDLRCEKQEEAVKRTDKLVDNILSQLMNLRNECDSLKDKSLLGRREVEHAYLYAERYREHLKKVHFVGGYYVVIKKGRSAADSLRKQLEHIATSRKPQSH